MDDSTPELLSQPPLPLVNDEFVQSRMNESFIYDTGDNVGDDRLGPNGDNEDWLFEDANDEDWMKSLEEGYDVWFDNFEEDKHAHEVNFLKLQVVEEPQYVNGLNKMKQLVKFCLVDIAQKFSYAGLQFELFLDAIPITMPVFFGKGFYVQYKNVLWKILGLNHDKVYLFFIGGRRDGKSILQASFVAGVLAIAETDDGTDFLIPLLGPGEATGIRMVGNISAMYVINEVKKAFSHLKVKKTVKKITVVDTRTGKVKVAEAKAPTATALRGVNSSMDAIDEATFIPYEANEKYNITRYKEDGVAGFAISTPNISEPRWKQFYKPSKVVRSVIKDQVCGECIEKNEQFDSPEELRKYCHSQGHRKPRQLPWKGEAHAGEWNIYHSKDILVAEEWGTSMSGMKHCFNRVKIQLWIHQRMFIPINSYDRFIITYDPADKGSSENAIGLAGVKGMTMKVYGLLSLTTFRVKDEQSTPKCAIDRISFMIEKLKTLKILYNTNRQKIYIFPEFFGHHGYEIHEGLKLRGYGKFVKVIKGLKNNTKYGVPATRSLKEEFIADTGRLINSNRLKIGDSFFTDHKKGPKHILSKLSLQMCNMVKTETGKITGKEGSQQDDLAVVTLMIATWDKKLTDMEDKLHPQMYFYLHNNTFTV